MTTALQIINRGAEICGYKDPAEVLDGTDSMNFLDVLNSLVESWQALNIFAYATTYMVQTVTGNPVTIGSGATLNTDRPPYIPGGGFFRNGDIDYPFDIVTREAWASLSYKAITTPWPRYCYYENSMPTGSLYFYPAISGSAELHLPIMQHVTAFADLATSYALTPGTKRALEYSMAEEIGAGIREIPASVRQMAINARNAIKRTDPPMLRTNLPGQLAGSILDGWSR